MSRRALRWSVVASAVLLVTTACSPIVWMRPYGPGDFRPLLDSKPIRLVDGRNMSRAELEAVIEEHRVLARFHTRLPNRGDHEEAVKAELEKAKRIARTAGGDAVLYLEDSSIMGVIFQNARYAGPPNAFVMYILRRR
jgi:hypothetical protein